MVISRVDGNVAENWSEDLDWYLEAAGLKSTSNSRMVVILLNYAGPDAVDVYENLPFESVVASKVFKTLRGIQHILQPVEEPFP